MVILKFIFQLDKASVLLMRLKGLYTNLDGILKVLKILMAGLNLVERSIQATTMTDYFDG